MLIKFLLHAITLVDYGFHHDELLSLSASNRLQWGYLGGPGFYHWFLALERALAGDSIWAVRLINPFAGALTIWAVARLYALFSSYRPGLLLTLASILFSPFFLGVHTYYNEHLFDQFFWILLFINGIAYCKSNEKRYLQRFIWVAATGLMVRLTIAAPIGLMFTGFFLSGRVKFNSSTTLKAAIFWLAALGPFLIWQFNSGWPVLLLMGNRANPPYVYLVSDILKNLIFVHNPLTAPVWLTGMVLLVARHGKALLPVTATIIIIITGHVLLKPSAYNIHYSAAIFPVLIAAGSGPFCQWLNRFKSAFRLYSIAFLLSGLVVIPLAVPLLPLGQLEVVSGFIQKNVHQKIGKIPPHFAMMMGWPELIKHVEQQISTLTSDEQLGLVIFAKNAGIAGASEYFGGDNLPPAISGHHEFWIWGKQQPQYQHFLLVNFTKDFASNYFNNYRELAEFECSLCRWRERTPVIVASGLKIPYEIFWDEMMRL